MKLISHRGNLNRNNSTRENTVDYIQEAIDKDYYVEIDIWLKKDILFLGHDKPQYKVSLDWLIQRRDKLFIHCKNFDALSTLIKTKLTIFYHEKEQYTIVSNGKIWAHNINEICNNCIIPLLGKEELLTYFDTNKKNNAWGICSDFVELIK